MQTIAARPTASPEPDLPIYQAGTWEMYGKSNVVDAERRIYGHEYYLRLADGGTVYSNQKHFSDICVNSHSLHANAVACDSKGNEVARKEQATHWRISISAYDPSPSGPKDPTAHFTDVFPMGETTNARFARAVEILAATREPAHAASELY